MIFASGFSAIRRIRLKVASAYHAATLGVNRRRGGGSDGASGSIRSASDRRILAINFTGLNPFVLVNFG